MRLLQDGVVAALSAIGLTTVLWLLAGAVIRPRRRGFLPAAALVTARADAAALESTVRALLRERWEAGSFARIVIVDGGMSEEARRVAQILCREELGVTLCLPSEVQCYLE